MTIFGIAMSNATNCDAIKQNESELEQNKNYFFIFIVCHHFRAISCWKHHQNWTFGSRDIAISVMSKTMKYKVNWMLLLALS